MIFRIYFLLVSGAFSYYLVQFLRLHSIVSDPNENPSTGLGFGYVYYSYALSIISVIFVVSLIYGIIRYLDKGNHR